MPGTKIIKFYLTMKSAKPFWILGETINQLIIKAANQESGYYKNCSNFKQKFKKLK